MSAKYVDALPLHRQEAIFERHGVSLPRATQAAWIIALTERVQPLINLMQERLLESGYIRMDETPVQVLKSEKAATSEHYMWVRMAGPARERILLLTMMPVAVRRSPYASLREPTDTSRVTAMAPTMRWPSGTN